MAEKRRIVNRVKPDGTLVLAGILAKEFPEVEESLTGLKMKLVASRVENGGVLVLLLGLKKFLNR